MKRRAHRDPLCWVKVSQRFSTADDGREEGMRKGMGVYHVYQSSLIG